jgi:hypothetical protein
VSLPFSIDGQTRTLEVDPSEPFSAIRPLLMRDHNLYCKFSLLVNETEVSDTSTPQESPEGIKFIVKWLERRSREHSDWVIDPKPMRYLKHNPGKRDDNRHVWETGMRLRIFL